MANINIRIPEDLHKKLKIKAVMSGITLKDYIIEILEKYLNEGGSMK